MSLGILFPTNEYTTSSKSPEQIQKLTFAEYKTIQQVLVHVVNKGLPPQMPYLYSNMHRAYKATLTFVCKQAPLQTSQNQLIIVSSLKQIVGSQKYNKSMEELELIFETCLECLNNIQSASNEEIKSLLELIIKIHPKSNNLLKRMEDVALDLGKAAQPIISRVTSGRIISILTAYSPSSIRGEMIDILKRILADTQVQAKKVWLTEIFPRILNNMNLEFVQLHLQEKIYECLWNDNQQIARCGLQVILKNSTKFSAQQQSSRIVKIFIDALTSTKQKISSVATELMGQTYQKLQGIILKNQNHCVRFWKSLIELSESRSSCIINNLIFNLPGILILSAPLHKVDPICDLYINLFYHPQSNKQLLASYFHEMVKLFPAKARDLRELVDCMLEELFDQEQPAEEEIKIMNIILQKMYICKDIFILHRSQQAKNRIEIKQHLRYFDVSLCDNILRYLSLLICKKNSSWLTMFYTSIKECCQYYPTDFVHNILLPKLIACIKIKTPSIDIVVETIVMLISRENDMGLINIYISKVINDLRQSTKSHQRQGCLLFHYYSSFYFSIDFFQENRLGKMYLCFANETNFKIRCTFIKNLPRIIYFLTTEETLQVNVILARLARQQDLQIRIIVQNMNFSQEQSEKNMIQQQSRRLRLKEKEKEKDKHKSSNIVSRKIQSSLPGRSQRQVKIDMIKKRVETTKFKNKIFIKQIPKKKNTISLVKPDSILSYGQFS